MDFVIVTAWRRPDFLRACLVRLLAADQGEQHYLIAIDRGPDGACEQVAQWFIRLIGPHRARLIQRSHPWHGNSYNVLSSYKDALDADTTAELIHLIEDDILVSKDYFTYHRAAHDLLPDVIAVSACRNQNLAEPPIGGDEVIYTHGSYQSLGVSFTRGQLQRIVSFAQPDYFRDPVTFCAETFPQSRIPRPHAEQDGLIHRIQEFHDLATAYPCQPRAYHAGFIGYHRTGTPLEGTIVERSEQILAMTSDDLNERADTFKDYEAVDLDRSRKTPTLAIELTEKVP